MTDLPLQTKIANNEQIQTELRINEVRFEGQYTQRSAAGFNNYKQTRTITWIPLSDADRITLENYFIERGGWQEINYDSKSWICKQHSSTRVQNAKQLWTYTATLETK